MSFNFNNLPTDMMMEVISYCYVDQASKFILFTEKEMKKTMQLSIKICEKKLKGAKEMEKFCNINADFLTEACNSPRLCYHDHHDMIDALNIIYNAPFQNNFQCGYLKCRPRIWHDIVNKEGKDFINIHPASECGLVDAVYGVKFGWYVKIRSLPLAAALIY
tara:strand:+ start:7227 stop:7712 length:486 start_codon:yes stop_codon:yes gene_type:complete